MFFLYLGDAMKTVFMTRRQYDRMCGIWKINGEEHNAYLFRKRKWSVEGVRITTDNVKLLELINRIKENN